MATDRPERDPLWTRTTATPKVITRMEVALDRLAVSDRWLDCSDPPHASCSDAGCPVHGEEGAVWVTCGGCGVLVPDGEECGECGLPL